MDIGFDVPVFFIMKKAKALRVSRDEELKGLVISRNMGWKPVEGSRYSRMIDDITKQIF